MPDLTSIQVIVDLEAVRDAADVAPGAGVVPVAREMLRRLVLPALPCFAVPDPPHCRRTSDDTCQSARHGGAGFPSPSSRWCAAALAAGASEDEV